MGDVRRSGWWWVAGLAFLVSIGAVLVYFARVPDKILSRADQLGSVGSLITGIVALLLAGVTLRIGMRPAEGRQGEQPPPAAGSLPRIWNVPVRNHAFLGRDGLLDALRHRLNGGGTAVVQALHGMGGVGKTQLAIEFAHRFNREYDLVWWVAAENSELIGDQYASLAIEADLISPDADTKTAVWKVKSHLRGRDRWLLLFDNAEDPTQLLPWLPEGPGHVVITSRNPAWGEIAAPVSVDVFTRAESIELLHNRLPKLTDGEADRLAEALGDLPLGVAQAAGTLAETGMSSAEYQAALAAKASQVLAESPPPTYPIPLAAAVRLSADRLSAEDPTAGGLLYLCAWLAPESIPVSLFVHLVEEPLPLHRAIGHISRFGLARIDPDGLQLHRLTQAILRDFVDFDTRSRVEALVIAAAPDSGSDLEQWPSWARLVPHILALDPAESTNGELRAVACNMVWYLLNRGDTRAALDLAQRYRECWLTRYGDADPSMLWATNHLAQAYRDFGELAKARPLNEEVYSRYRSVHGEDHPFTLTSANNLANDLRELGEAEAARALHEDTLVRRRRVLGDDHPNTLTSANNLANVLRELGEMEAARALHEDTLVRRRRVLGDDHLRTLRTANSLAGDLVEMGRLHAARELHEDTLARRRRVLGDDHSDTVESVVNLAGTLRAVGDVKAARKLEREAALWKRRTAGRSMRTMGAVQSRSEAVRPG
jgi:Tetratricopeptide repeat/NB-ARC domain